MQPTMGSIAAGLVILSLVFWPIERRWHHTSQAEGRDKNFAGLFPFIDALFGTLYLPDEQPRVFGVEDAPVPAGVLPQLLHPFR